MSKNKGFTIIEIVMVVVILALLTSIVFASLYKLNSEQALEKSASLVVSVLDEARSLTLSSKDNSQYGVYFTNSSLTLFKGASYSPSSPDNVVTTLDTRVGMREIVFAGGGSSVIFQRLTGATSQPGRVELFLHSSTTNIRAVNITSTGVANINLE